MLDPKPARIGAVATAVLMTAFLVACNAGTTPTPASQASPAGGSGASAGASAGGATSGSVSIAGFAYNPASVTVALGTEVTWTNSDTTAHTVTADDNSFDSKNMAQNATFKQTFSTAGTFTYHCSIHPNMKGTVVVQ